MQAVLAYYDAQMEYAKNDRDGDGKLSYARRIISTPGARDGLYWEVRPDEAPSPLGPLMADDTPGGGYHGYFDRILESQGKHARGGAYSDLIGGQMTAGFALISWPAEYGGSGVMSFMVSHAGIVYEKNLGPDGCGSRIFEQTPEDGHGEGPEQHADDSGAWTACTIWLRDSMPRHFPSIVRNSAIAPQYREPPNAMIVL